jgi:hypothetical protein
MPYTTVEKIGTCTVCTSPANILRTSFGVGELVDCSRCGDFEVDHGVADEVGLPFAGPKKQALASYTIRKMQASGRAPLTREFFRELERRALPTPAEASDNLIIWIAEQADGRPGAQVQIIFPHAGLLGAIGAVNEAEVSWIVNSLTARRLLHGVPMEKGYNGFLTIKGWEKYEELRRAHVSSSFAFFARQFANADLNTVFDDCLRPAVEATGYKLRTVTQRAGLIDAIIEDEIRRCRFLIADLSDDNAGAYWEAGFAEGLGKPVIYICRAEKSTHFDTAHRHTVKWDLGSLDETAVRLKAVIRNTLLADAEQSD